MTDICIESTPRSQSRSVLQGLVALFDTIVRRVRENREKSRKRRQLTAYLTLEDWVLDDMGFTRADIYGAIDTLSDVSVEMSLDRARRVNLARPLRGIRRR